MLPIWRYLERRLVPTPENNVGTCFGDFFGTRWDFCAGISRKLPTRSRRDTFPAKRRSGALSLIMLEYFLDELERVKGIERSS